MKTFTRIICILPFICLVSDAAERGCSSAPPDFPGATLVRFTPEKAQYKCAEGHEGYAGSRMVQCADGQWGRLTMKCKKKSCGNAGELTNGFFEYNGEPELGVKAYPVCANGFTVKGPTSIECGITGWSEPLPTCEEGVAPVTCPAPEVTNSDKKGVAREYKVGDVLTVKCSPRFQKSGADQITCGSDGKWQPSPPQCVPAPPTNEGVAPVTCPAPEVTNSEKKGVAREYKVGDMLTVKCSPRFQKSGADQITCGSDGKWQPSPPQCVPAPPTNGGCGAPENPEGSNSNLAPKYKAKKSFAAGALVYYMCDVGYVHARGSKYRSCTQGQWSPLQLRCKRRLCGSAGELLNGHYEYTGAAFGDRATAVCDEGFQLVGQKTRNCMVRGWDGHDPVCEAFSCDDPPEVPNAEVLGYAEAPFEYRSVVRYRCLVGALLGPADIWCTENGTWSSPLPQCKDITCPTPNIPNASWVRSRSGRYQLRDSIYVRCNARYTLAGPSTITCDEKGQWSPELPKCKVWRAY